MRYGPRRPVPTKLDAYKAIVQTRLAAYPALSAVRLLAEIRAAGYGGSYTQLKAWVRQIRPTPPPAPVIRFETPAGRLAQVDFARFSFAWGVRYALLVVLGYSRVLWCRFYPRQDMRTLIAGLEQAFHDFGGVPQELLFDQMKAVINARPAPAGRRARPQSRVSAVCAPLELHAARVSPLPSADEGQSRASGPVSAGQLRLWTDLRQRRRPRSTATAVARRHRQRTGARDDAGASARPFRAR